MFVLLLLTYSIYNIFIKLNLQIYIVYVTLYTIVTKFVGRKEADRVGS